jgi:hypothetical protein
MKKKILATIIFIVIYLAVLDVFIKGPVGISPQEFACLGVEISPETPLIRILPEGNIGLKYPFEFRYEIDRGTQEQVYCLGKNI